MRPITATYDRLNRASCLVALVALVLASCALPSTAPSNPSPRPGPSERTEDQPTDTAPASPGAGGVQAPAAVDGAFVYQATAACRADPRTAGLVPLITDQRAPEEMVLYFESQHSSLTALATRAASGTVTCTPLAGGSRSDVDGGDFVSTDWIANGNGWIVAGFVSPRVTTVTAFLDDSAPVAASVGNGRFLAQWTTGSAQWIDARDASGALVERETEEGTP